MGSVIGIGFIFNKIEESEADNLFLDIFNEQNTKEKINVYFSNSTYDKWIKESFSDIEQFSVKKYKNFKVEFRKEINNYLLDVYIIKHYIKNLVCYTIYFYEEQLLDCFYNFKEINKYIDCWVLKLYEKHKFNFACCDNGLVVDDDLFILKNTAYRKFSISYIINGDKIKIIKQDWDLDGCTPRLK